VFIMGTPGDRTGMRAKAIGGIGRRLSERGGETGASGRC
jgi:hypothetical protein